MRRRPLKRRHDETESPAVKKIRALCDKGVALIQRANEYLVEFARKHRHVIWIIRLVLKVSGILRAISGGKLISYISFALLMRCAGIISRFANLIMRTKIGTTPSGRVFIKILLNIVHIIAMIRKFNALDIVSNIAYKAGI